MISIQKYHSCWYPVNRHHQYPSRNHVVSDHYLDGLVQERRNSSALAMELRLSCINPLIWSLMGPSISHWDVGCKLSAHGPHYTIDFSIIFNSADISFGPYSNGLTTANFALKAKWIFRGIHLSIHDPRCPLCNTCSSPWILSIFDTKDIQCGTGITWSVFCKIPRQTIACP